MTHISVMAYLAGDNRYPTVLFYQLYRASNIFMKRISVFFMLALYMPALAAQDSLLQGRVVYFLEGSKSVNNKIEMWFSARNYAYMFSQGESLFTEKRPAQDNLQDSLKNDAKERVIREKLSKISPQKWYGELGSDIVVFSWHNINTDESYCVQDTLSFVKWELAADTMTIRGIPCQKATGRYNGMQYLAWFATSIPTSAAPLHYRGLPGLLIECTNQTRNTKFGMAELHWPVEKGISIQPCTEGRRISARELNAIINSQNNMLQQLINNAEDAKKNNRPIKLQDAMKGNN